jgi:hypothetical protein
MVVSELAGLSDWTAVVSGGVTSTFAEGPMTGPRALPSGGVVTLCCDASSFTREVQQRAYGGADWGADTPEWRLFAWGPASGWLGAGRISSLVYVAVWIADDPHDGDGNPRVDSNQTVAVHAQAYAATGSRRVVEALVQRPVLAATGGPSAGVRNVFWREIRW